jgi:hypothetical protein
MPLKSRCIDKFGFGGGGTPCRRLSDIFNGKEVSRADVESANTDDSNQTSTAQVLTAVAISIDSWL